MKNYPFSPLYGGIFVQALTTMRLYKIARGIRMVVVA